MMHDNALNIEPRNEHNSHEIHELNKAHDVNRDHHAVVHQGHREHGEVPVTVRNMHDDHVDERHLGLDPHREALPRGAQQPVDAPERTRPREKAPQTPRQNREIDSGRRKFSHNTNKGYSHNPISRNSLS